MRRLIALLLLSCAALAGAAVAAPAGAADNTPLLRVSAGDLVFDDVAVGSTRTQDLTVTNAGGGTLPLTNPTVYGGDSKDFAVAATTCRNGRLTAGQTCTVTVAFTPTAMSTRISHLGINTAIQGCVSYVSVAGSGATTTSGNPPTTRGGYTTRCDGLPVPDATPVPVTPVPTTTPGTSTTTTTISQDGAVLGTSSSGARTCKSKRRLRIHVKAPAGKAFKRGSMTVKTKGRTFKAKRVTSGRRKGQYVVPLSFKGLRIGRYTVRIKATLTNGKRFSATRRFVTCVSAR